MIKSKSDLREYLKADLGSCPGFFQYKVKILSLWLRGSEGLPVWRLVYSLRHYEYYYNQNDRLSLWEKIKKQYWRFVYRHTELKYDIYVGVNVCGSGLKLVHPGFRRLHTVASIGKNVTILPMVLIGKKIPKTDCKAIIGDHVYISTGVTILGPVTIGNNVTIGAGAVVTHDIPDNAVVAGVPAKIINVKQVNEMPMNTINDKRKALNNSKLGGG